MRHGCAQQLVTHVSRLGITGSVRRFQRTCKYLRYSVQLDFACVPDSHGVSALVHTVSAPHDVTLHHRCGAALQRRRTPAAAPAGGDPLRLRSRGCRCKAASHDAQRQGRLLLRQ